MSSRCLEDVGLIRPFGSALWAPWMRTGTKLHVWAFAAEVEETATELRDRLAGAPGSLGEEDQGVLVAESFQHLLERLGSISLAIATEGAGVQQGAVDQTASNTLRT